MVPAIELSLTAKETATGISERRGWTQRLNPGRKSIRVRLIVLPGVSPGGSGSGEGHMGLGRAIVAKNVIENRRDRKKDRRDGDEKDEKTEEKK